VFPSWLTANLTANRSLSALTAWCCIVAVTCEYTSKVMLTCAWPSISLTTLGCTPIPSSSVAALWRQSHGSASSAARPASSADGSCGLLDCKVIQRRTARTPDAVRGSENPLPKDAHGVHSPVSMTCDERVVSPLGSAVERTGVHGLISRVFGPDIRRCLVVRRVVLRGPSSEGWRGRPEQAGPSRAREQVT
jgi:hypothetical protein